MQFVILITAAPVSQQGAYTAYHYARALLAQSHQLRAVFFYQDGCYHACTQHEETTLHPDLYYAWQQLSTEHGFLLALCRTAATQRAVLHGATAIATSSLAQFIDICQTADRIITFGA